MFRWLGAGACILVALFCAYGFLAAGESSGAAKVAWKTGYVAVGLLALLGAAWQAARRT